MLKIWKTENGITKQIQKPQPDSLVSLINPTEEEINLVQTETNIRYSLFKKVLDKHESARIETKDKATLVVLSIPIKKEIGFRTVPLGAIISKDIAIVLVNNEQLGKNLFKNFEKTWNIDTALEIEFLLKLFLEITSHYQIILNEMQSLIEIKEKNLLKASSNADMKELLEIQKGLVYFIKALNTNEVVFEKLLQGNFLTLNSENKILLEDIIIENKQAINMATLYQDLLKSVMDSYETIISNNLNKVMKFLTGITIVFTIPTMVSSFMGMNVKLGFFNDNDMAFIILVLISIALALIVALIFKRKNWL